MYSRSASRLLPAMAASITLFIAACHDDSLIEELRETKDKVCQCPDTACVAALRASSEKLEKRLHKLSSEDQDKARAIALEMMACVQKI